MSQNLESLFLVYSFMSSVEQTGDFEPARYHIRGVYHKHGAVPLSELQELAKAITHENFIDLRFNSLEEIKSFAERLFADFTAESLYLLSAQDFNLALEATTEASKLSSHLIKYGEKLVNTEMVKSKGFFGKFFS